MWVNAIDSVFFRFTLLINEVKCPWIRWWQKVKDWHWFCSYLLQFACLEYLKTVILEKIKLENIAFSLTLLKKNWYYFNICGRVWFSVAGMNNNPRWMLQCFRENLSTFSNPWSQPFQPILLLKLRYSDSFFVTALSLQTRKSLKKENDDKWNNDLWSFFLRYSSLLI